MVSKKLNSLAKKSVVDEIIDSITNSILQGQFKAGDKLPNEFELMEQLNVSRNSLREAMKILAATGIVEIKRGDGTYISSSVKPTVFDKVIYSLIYDLSSSDELLELRQMLDAATVQLSIDKITPGEIDKIQKNINEMCSAIEHKDIEKAKKLDLDFHMDLIDSCKNVFFIRIIKGVYSLFENSIFENLKLEDVSSKATDYHQNILNCIKNKDYANIQQVVADSLKTWRERV